MKVLFITTSHDKLGDTNGRTGVWLEEIAAPYYIFKDAGVEMAIASPLGGEVPLDPKSQSIIVATPSTKRFLKDEVAMSFLSRSVRVEEIDGSGYDMIFLPGGHGPMWDLPGNEPLRHLLESFYNGKKLIAAVCHGVAGLISMQNDKGELVIKGKRLTGFSNTEEESTGLAAVVPFLLETRLVELGVDYSRKDDYMNYVVTDGNIITGQNPSSSAETARKSVLWMKNPVSTGSGQIPVSH
jgi:putative intracellular protease/amidase